MVYLATTFFFVVYELVRNVLFCVNNYKPIIWKFGDVQFYSKLKTEKKQIKKK